MEKEKKIIVSNKSGFTLVELIVAMAVFLAAVTFAVGVFIQGMRAQRRLMIEIVVNNDVNLVLEQMMRDIRLGYEFVSGGNGEMLDFRGRDTEASIRYSKRPDNTLVRSVDGVSRDMTSENVEVADLRFDVYEETTRDDCDPWRVSVFMSVRPSGLPDSRKVSVQATVSSRVLPLDIDKDEYRRCRDIYES